MACSQIAKFTYATEHLGPTIWHQAKLRSLWMNVPRRGTFPMNVGTAITTFGIRPIEPTDDTGQWAPVDLGSVGTVNGATTTGNITSMEGNAPSYTSLTDNAEGGAVPFQGETGLCFNHWQDVHWGHDKTTYGPEMSLLRGPEVCERELLFHHNVGEFIAGYVNAMKGRAQRQWENWIAYHHRRLSAKAVVLTDLEANVAEQADMGATNALNEATGELTQDVLEYLAQRLMFDGATNPDEDGFVSWDNGPVFTLNIGSYMSKRLLKAGETGFRTDVNYAKPDLLLGRLGATFILGNFRHNIDMMPRRYTFSNGAYTPVPPFTTAAGSVGTKYVKNSAYDTAPYEAADIVSPWLFTMESVNAPTSAGGVALSADGANYSGNWSFQTGAYKWRGMETSGAQCMEGGDPLDQIGRHFAQFMAAPHPNPIGTYKYGYHVIYKRCLFNKITITTCSS